MFQTDKFIADCQTALSADTNSKALRKVMAEAVQDRAGIVAALGKPKEGGIQKIHEADDLSIINVVWPPFISLKPHNHNMPAVIGVYQGRENNIFWRRIAESAEGKIEAAGAESIGPGGVVLLGRDIIHSVSNPLDGYTAAIHVYRGNFFTKERSEWNPADLNESAYDLEGNMALFQRANTFAAGS